MGYLSFDASIKIHKSGKWHSTKSSKTGNGGIYGYIRHIDRANDKKDGHEVQHSNKNIDSDLTLNNESYFKDENGNWKKAEHSSDLLKSINSRIDYAKKNGARIYDGGKNDTCIVRPLLVQVGDDVLKEHEETWKDDIIKSVENMFGKENIVGVSFHEDETSPHAHILFVPVFEDFDKSGNKKCYISQTKFFKNPSSLASMHRKLRKDLQDKGYSISQGNKPIEEHLAGYTDKNGIWHQKGLTPQQLEELTKRKVDLKMQEIDLKQKKEQLEKREREIRDIGQKLSELKDELRKNKEEIEAEKNGMLAQKAMLAKKEEMAEEEKRDLQKQMESFVEESEKTLEMFSAISKEYHDNAGELDEDFLEYCKKINYVGGRTAFDHFTELHNKYKKRQQERQQKLFHNRDEARKTVEKVSTRIRGDGKRPLPSFADALSQDRQMSL